MGSARIILAALAALACCAHAQRNNQYATTPVPILKQINRHNDDGSYSYGYEGADGSFKIETKHATGEVFGKYGYVDDTGSVREVEYGASKRGFEVSGTGINVPPPTLTNNARSSDYGNDDYDDGQYREDPSVYYKEVATPHRFNSQQTRLNNFPQQQQQPQQQQYNQQQYNQPQQYNQQQYNQQQYVAPQQRYNPPPQQYRQAAAPAVNNADLFKGHPATNFDWRTGSYSVNYSG